MLARYPGEVREQRRVSKKLKKAALLVHVDADAHTVEDELLRFAAELKKAGHAARAAGERIAVAIPKRHTETWLHGLCGVPVTELQDCKRDSVLKKTHDAKIDRAAKQLYAFTRPKASAPPTQLPSLTVAVSELRRLES